MGNEPYHEMNRPTAMPHLVNAFNRMVQLLADNGLQNDIKVLESFRKLKFTISNVKLIAGIFLTDKLIKRLTFYRTMPLRDRDQTENKSL